MNRVRRSTLLLLTVIVLLLVLPGIGDAVRGAVTYLFGDTSSRYIGVLASIVTILTFLYVLVKPWLLELNQRSTKINTATPASQTNDGQSRNPEGAGVDPTNNAEDEARRRIRDETRQVARDLYHWQHERSLDDPFSRAEEIPRNMESAEYKELEAKYDQHKDETERQYNNELLPRVAQVRADLASHDVKDSELNRLYGRPKNYDDYRTVSERLWEMAGQLDRRIPPQARG